MFFNIEYEIYLTRMAVFLIFSLFTSENFKHPATLMKWIQYPASEHELSSLEIRGHRTETGKTSCYAFLAGPLVGIWYSLWPLCSHFPHTHSKCTYLIDIYWGKHVLKHSRHQLHMHFSSTEIVHDKQWMMIKLLWIHVGFFKSRHHISTKCVVLNSKGQGWSSG